MAADRALAQDALGRGIDFWNAGDTTNAFTQFHAAREANPALVAVHYWLGLAHEATGEASEARRAWSRYLGADPNGEYAENARQRLIETDR